MATSVWVPKLTGKLTSPPSSLSLAGQTLESLANETTSPCLPSFLAFPPILPLHSPSTRGATNRNGVSSSTVTAASLPAANPSNINIQKAAWWLGTSQRFTEQHLHGVNYKRGSASSREPNGGVQRHWKLKKKTTETVTRSSLATVYACRVSGWSIPGKIWMLTNQIRAVATRAHVPRELRARALQASGGI